VVRSPVDDEPVAKRQRKYYNPFQAYCERTRPVLGYGLVKEEATLSDDINEDINELELWQSSWEDGDNDVRDPISYWHERKRRYPRLSPDVSRVREDVCGGRADGDATTKSAGRGHYRNVSSAAIVVTGWGD
ncbi:hypothetical protein FOXB_16290, partial [Fusarium oxysporum f. sp. conglutinans Fo5176]